MNQQGYSETGLTHKLEAAKGQAEKLMRSKFGILPEGVEIECTRSTVQVKFNL